MSDEEGGGSEEDSDSSGDDASEDSDSSRSIDTGDTGNIGANPGTGAGTSGTGPIVSQSEDVISNVGSLLDNRDTIARAGSYGRGGGDFDVASDQPDGSVPTNVVFGCTDKNAINYNPLATLDDGSCSDTNKVLGDDRIFTPFKTLMEEMPNTLKMPDLGMFKSFFTTSMRHGGGAGSVESGTIMNTEEEESTATAGSNTFNAGMGNAKYGAMNSASLDEDDFQTEMLAIMKDYSKAAWYVSTGNCAECDEDYVDSYLEITAIIIALALASPCVNYVNGVTKVKKLLTALLGRTCKNC